MKALCVNHHRRGIGEPPEIMWSSCLKRASDEGNKRKTEYQNIQYLIETLGPSRYIKKVYCINDRSSRKAEKWYSHSNIGCEMCFFIWYLLIKQDRLLHMSIFITFTFKRKQKYHLYYFFHLTITQQLFCKVFQSSRSRTS